MATGKVGAKRLHAQKESIIKRLNERMASIIRHAGTANEDYNRWVAKLTRPNSPYRASETTYDPSKIELDRNKGAVKEKVEYMRLSRKRSDIEAMDLKDLERLEAQTRGWGEVKKEAKEALQEQRHTWDVPEDYNPFEPDLDEEAAEPAEITDTEISEYLNQKEAVRQFIESDSDSFYALIEATGWDDIKDHTTEEIYQAINELDLYNYEFEGTLTEIGESYKARRDASREHRRALGIL